MVKNIWSIEFFEGGGGGEMEEICEIILYVLYVHARDLLPIEQMNGLVTEDKLAKFHKKTGKGLDMWNGLIKHIKHLGKDKRMGTHEVVEIFSNTLVGDMSNAPPGEESRIKRKVISLLEYLVPPPSSPTKEGKAPGEGFLFMGSRTSRSGSKKKLNLSTSSSFSIPLSVRLDELEADDIEDDSSLGGVNFLGSVRGNRKAAVDVLSNTSLSSPSQSSTHGSVYADDF